MARFTDSIEVDNKFKTQRWRPRAESFRTKARRRSTRKANEFQAPERRSPFSKSATTRETGLPMARSVASRHNGRALIRTKTCRNGKQYLSAVEQLSRHNRRDRGDRSGGPPFPPEYPRGSLTLPGSSPGGNNRS